MDGLRIGSRSPCQSGGERSVTEKTATGFAHAYRYGSESDNGRMDRLDAIDHVAVPVKNVRDSVDWYTRTFHCDVRYQDETWALLAFANVRLALVIPEQHPPHIGLVSDEAERFGALKLHRDGTRSCYVDDPAGNSVEILARDSMPSEA